MSDTELLRHYAREGANPSFAALVHRHLDLVYSVARRHVSSSQVAEDVAQAVFIELARNARKIDADTPLVAWLHVVSRRIAINAARGEARRHAREQIAAEIAAMKSPPPSWETVAPILDEAVESLPASDRAAILLRYFENKKLRDVGAALGLSDDAAQKRVSRALEQLRTFFLRRGVAVTAAGLASDLSAHALGSAPLTLGPIIAAAASAVPTAAVSAAATFAMTTLQKSVAVATLVVVAGAGLYQARVVARQSDELSGLELQTTRAANEVHDQRLAHAAVAAKLGEVERQIDSRLRATHPVDAADAALESQMNQWLDQMDRIKEFLTQRPAWYIPELKLLTEQDWFNAAATERLESEEQFRRVTSRLRDLAAGLAAQKIMKALNSFVRTSDGMLPNSPFELASHFDSSFDSEILGRYEMLKTGKLSDVPRNELTRILAPKPVDVEYDAYSFIGTNGYGNTGVAMAENVRHARRQFSQANAGERAITVEQLRPYLRWPVSAAALQQYLDRQASPGTP